METTTTSDVNFLENSESQTSTGIRKTVDGYYREKKVFLTAAKYTWQAPLHLQSSTSKST